MTKDFSFRRLLLLIKKQWIENAKFYLYGALALLGLLGIIFLFWLNMGGHRYDEDSLIIIFLVGLFLSGAIFASTSFNRLGNKAKGIYWLSFPASHLEKLICMIFYNMIVFTLVYCLCYFFIEQIALSYIHHLVESDPIQYSFRRLDWSKTGRQPAEWTIIRYFFYGFFAVQALYLLGSVYFKRYSFILTTIITAFIFFCFILYVQNFLYASSSGLGINADNILYISKYQSVPGYFKRYELNATVSNVFIFLVRFIWAPFFWLVTWFRLKEKEI